MLPSGVLDQDITRLLIEWRQGREGAFDALLPLVYDGLRRIASRQMAREPLNDALRKLAAEDERKNHAVELKYFGGLTDKEIAEVLGIAVVTVRRDLKVAHAFLHWQMTGASR
jgi:RNA polymerase sigma factor (sigma-70 family)